MVFVKNIESVVKNITGYFQGLKEFWTGVFTLDFDMILGGLEKMGGCNIRVYYRSIY